MLQKILHDDIKINRYHQDFIKFKNYLYNFTNLNKEQIEEFFELKNKYYWKVLKNIKIICATIIHSLTLG